MTYFTTPSELAFALLFAGLIVSIFSLVATINTAAVRPGSPAAVQDVTSHRVTGIIGAALIAAGSVPLLFAPVHALVALATR